MNAAAEREWIYLKVFIGPSGKRADTAILDYVRPAVQELEAEGLIDRYFFIVYGEEAPHIRLRVSTLQPLRAEEIRRRLESPLPSLFETLETIPLEPGIWPVAITRSFPDFEYDTYQPELHVYGGPLAMPHVEKHFQDSSELAFRILEAQRNGQLQARTLVLPLVEMLVEEFSWMPGCRAEFYAEASDHWLRELAPEDSNNAREYFAARYAALEPRLDGVLSMPANPPRVLEPILAGWRESVTRTARALHALESEGQLATPVRYIVQSLIHMLHNRLGIPVNQETFNLYLLRRYCERPRP